MPFAALAYPVTPVLIGLTVFVYMLLCLPKQPQKARRILYNLFFASVLAIALLLVKYLFPSPEIGPMTSRLELLYMPEMYPGGLSPYLPVPPLYKEVLSHIHPLFTPGSALLFLLILRKDMENLIDKLLNNGLIEITD